MQLAGGTAFTSPDEAAADGNGANGHLNGPIDDIQLRSWGIQLVDGRMPGFAAIVGCAKSNEVAVKIVRELQRRNILTFLSRQRQRPQHHPSAAWKKASSWATTPTPCPSAPTPSRAIYALGFATRSALTFGGMKGGQARDILLYNKNRVFAFVLALGEVDDLKYATAAGAINFGFPVIADTVIPEILPTGVTTYEHVVSMPFNEIDGKDDLERAERLVQKCIEVRGVKVKVTEVPIPVPYGSAFEGEVVRKTDMRVEFGGKHSRALRVPAHGRAGRSRGRQDRGRRPRTSRRSTRRARWTWASWSRSPGARCSRTSSRCSSARSTTSSTAPPASSTSASATSPGSASARPRPTRASTCSHFGEILHARFHDDFGSDRGQGAGDDRHRAGAARRVAGEGPRRPTTNATCAWAT